VQVSLRRLRNLARVEITRVSMSAIRTNAAAVMLGVSPNTLRSWERRFGFPAPTRTSGGHRQFERSEIEALRQAFEETQNVSSAIALARERGQAPPSASRLTSAHAAFDEDQANRLLEESLALRSLERTIEDVLLPAVGELDGDEGPSPEFEFAWRHATGWLCAMRRLAPPASRPEGILILDGSAPGDADALHVQALELVLRRAGLRTLTLTSSLDPARLGRALRALQPSGLVLAGRNAPLEAIGRLVYAVRSSAGDIEVCDFRGAVPDTGASTVFRLGDSPLAARDALIERLAARAALPEAPPVPALAAPPRSHAAR
jgi:MerR family transcriptional regulator, light-induced transcriptional regulator